MDFSFEETKLFILNDTEVKMPDNSIEHRAEVLIYLQMLGYIRKLEMRVEKLEKEKEQNDR